MNNKSNSAIDYKEKYIKYKKKYLDYKIKIIGGSNKSGKTYDELVLLIWDLPKLILKNNLVEYYNEKLKTLDKIIKQNNDKISNGISIEKSNILSFLNETDKDLEKNEKEKLEKANGNPFLTSKKIIEYDNEAILLQNYKNAAIVVTDTITDHLAKRESVIKIKSIRVEYEKVKNEIHRYTDVQITNYLENIIKYCDNNISPPFDDYKTILLEYLFAILKGVKNIESDPFKIIITGSPGVGKSYIALQLAELIKLTKLLPIGTMINIKKPDVIGQYIGTTAPKTYKILTDSLGKVIFIDEAYSFAGAKTSNGYDQFGKEFIDAIVDFITEYPGLISIIAAGYKKEMIEQFIDVNSGISRRFAIKLNIERYTTIELLNQFNYLTVKKNLNEDILSSYPNEQINKYIPNQLLYFINFFDFSKTEKKHAITNNFKIIFVKNIKTDYLKSSNVVFETDISKNDTINIKDLDIETTFICSILLSCSGVKYGDLFNNQISDLIEYIQIIKIILATIKKGSYDTDTTCINIFKAYIIYKTNFIDYKNFYIKKNQISKDYNGIGNVLILYSFVFELKNTEEYPKIELEYLSKNSLSFIKEKAEIMIQLTKTNSDYILYNESDIKKCVDEIEMLYNI